ncbi:MAG: adenylate kinase family protein [Candidatus Magasanikbacteria bacterium]
MNRNSRVVSIYGPPGAGKGTQAELMEKRFNFVHFDTGSYIENLLYSPQAKNNKELQKKRKGFEEGSLLDPMWVREIVVSEIKNMEDSELSLVFSGSPRTVIEAFGNNSKKGVIEILENSYGRQNIDFVFLEINDQTSIKRNSKRTVCSVCSLPILGDYELDRCPFCKGGLRTRTLDKPEVIQKRLEEFRDRTKPILSKLRERGYEIHKVDGTKAPYRVHKKIAKALNLERLKNR